MEAQLCRCIFVLLAAFISLGASYKTPNFITHAPTPEIAKQIGDAAEIYRRELAITWLGHELPSKWSAPCPIKVKVGNYGAGGATTFSFDRGHVFGWDMQVQGTLQRILDSVLPHEINHTIFACHFRRPLPRWADEGAATIVEHESERARQRLINRQVMGTNQRIPLRRLLSMKEYPTERQQILTLYAEGYSLADYLLQTGGKKRYLMFLEDADKNGWDEAIAKQYRFKNVEELEQRWGNWIMAGSPSLQLPAGQQLAATSQKKTPVTETKNLVIRSQSPDQEEESVPLLPGEQIASVSLDPMESSTRKSRPLPIESRIPFGGRKATSSQNSSTAAFTPEPQRTPPTASNSNQQNRGQRQSAQVSSQPRRVPQNRGQRRPMNRYNRSANPRTGGISLGESAEIDF